MTKTGAELGALAYELWGSKGVPVFPCSDKKRPLCKWQSAASTEKGDILRSFAQAGGRAVFIGAVMGEQSGLFAVDFDLYKSGAAEYKAVLEASGLLPATRTHKTVSGGIHSIFHVPDGTASPRNSVPHDGVEIRGEGGYIIVPGSPGYEVISDKTVEAPDGLLTRLDRERKAFNNLPISRLKQKIIEGVSFHDAAALIAAKLSGRGIKPEEIRATIEDAFNGSVAANPRHHRHSRWEAVARGKDGELGRILASAYRKYSPHKDNDDVNSVADPRGSVDVGGLFRAPAADDSADGGGGASAPDVVSQPVTGFPFKRAYAAANVSDQDTKTFLVHPLIMEGDVVVLSAAPKAGKTLTAMSLCLHMGAGIPFGNLTPLDQTGQVCCIPVVYFALEGQGAVRKRVKGWLEHQSKVNNYTFTEDNVLLYVVEQPVNLADAEAKQKIVDQLVLANKFFEDDGGIGMVVFDTLTKSMPGKDQNSVEDTSEVFHTVDMMRDVGIDAAVMFIHHNNKQGGGPRGSSNILAEPDTILSVDKVAGIVKNGNTMDCYQLDVFMARAVDDTQSYKMCTHEVDIGKNTQGITEHAPVLEMLEDYDIQKTKSDDTLGKHAAAARDAFYTILYSAVSSASHMQMQITKLHDVINSSKNAAAIAFYNQYRNGTDKAGLMATWKVLLADKSIPPSAGGITFVITGDVAQMHLSLGGSSVTG